MGGTHPIVNNAFECVLQFLLQPIGLQYIDDADVEQQAFPLLAASGNATRSAMEEGREVSPYLQ